MCNYWRAYTVIRVSNTTREPSDTKRIVVKFRTVIRTVRRAQPAKRWRSSDLPFFGVCASVFCIMVSMRKNNNLLKCVDCNTEPGRTPSLRDYFVFAHTRRELNGRGLAVTLECYARSAHWNLSWFAPIGKRLLRL